MMKNSNDQDERVVMVRRKIQSDGFQIVVLGLIASVLVQQYIFKAPFVQYAAEMALFFVMLIYVLVRNLIVGNDLFSFKKRGQSTVVIYSLVLGIITAATITIRNYITYGGKGELPVMLNVTLVAGISFISATASAFALMEVFYLANKKKQKQIEEHLNEIEDKNE